ncbi:hypothetical protein OHC33_001805 [Knufia fluminis]|uniref:SPT2 chromatin protein n=1 Tax=Knufia fluminis TaxID=191047 RepID=A0AAN8FFA0_9EURO|nr:hypothetical protein OHC33_001805 [Knufia fluminis]
MSFLGDLVGSIGGERAPAPPARPLSKPTTTNYNLAQSSKSAPPTPSAGSASGKPVYKGTANPGATAQVSSLKRKAEEISAERPVKLPRPTPSLQTDRNGQKPSKLNGSATTSPAASKPANGLPSTQVAQNAASAPAKAPAKGSYAELMARAKQAQSTKTPSSLGQIKHQTTEKIKHSKLAERKKEEQQKGKAPIPAPGQNGRTGLNGKVDPRRRSASPVKKGEQARPKQPKAPSGPLHGPPQAKAAPPTYKGTMGQAPKKPREEMRKKKSRYDDYLGTDEEEEDDFIEDDDGYGYGRDEPDYYSDASSDMEGGFDDVEREEREALKAAKTDDQKELELEMRLKKEKQARLAALARKNRK